MSGVPLWRTLGLLVCMIGNTSAAQFGNYLYTDNGTTVTITGCSFTTTGSIAIPPTIYGKPVTEIATEAFKSRSNITAITFPATMAKIGQGAFRGCAGLGSITLPSGIKGIEPNLFFGCTSLKSVTVPAGVTSIGSGAFSDCKLLSALNIPAGVTFIDSLAFNGCEALQSLSLPASLSTLATSALFGGGFKTLSVAAESPYLSSSNGVLYNKNKSTLVRYPPKKSDLSHVVQAGVTQIGSDAFQGSRYLRNLTLPTGLTVIGDSAFASCISLTGINIPQGITTIPDQAFYGCTSLPSITLPSGVKTIGYFAFQGCTKLSTITLSDDLTTIKDWAFDGSGITQIHLPANVTNLGFPLFQGCAKLKSITVAAENPAVSSVDGVLFNKNRTAVYKYPAARAGSYRIPNGVVTIGDYSFGGAAGLTAIRIPSTVTSIDWRAFEDCDSLTSLKIPASVIYLGNYAISSCDALQQLVFTGNAPTISLSPLSYGNPVLTVGYYNNRTGFTSPTWQGYPSVNLGDWIDSPQDLKVEENPGGELVHGGAVTGLGSAPIGSSSVVTLTLTNAGSSDLTNIAISINGANAADFHASALDTDYLIGGESTTFQITFSPKALGARTAGIQIASSDADENPFELSLSGTGTTPEISIEQPLGSSVADGGSREFGSITVGGHSTLTFTVKNTGSEDLTGLGLSLAGTHMADFSVSKSPSAPVAEGEDTSFSIDFTPSGGGTRSAVLRVASNDSDESPYDIILTGKGVVVPEISIDQPPGSKLVDGVSKKSFGTVKIGTTGKAKTFTIKNTGTAKLTGLSLSRNGKHAKDFIVTGFSQTSLAPGKSATFKVAFKPTAKGTRSAAIHLKSNDADESPFDIQITGMGSSR